MVRSARWMSRGSSGEFCIGIRWRDGGPAFAWRVMPSFELRFRRKPHDPILTVCFDAPDAMEAMMLLPRNQGFETGELWTDGKFLFSVSKAENNQGIFWIVSPDTRLSE